MTTKHTPGQLHSAAQMHRMFDKDSDGKWVEIKNREHGAAAFVVWRMDGDECSPEKEAFALKVAAANELFDALSLCEGNISSLADTHPAIYTEWLKVVRAAIAKATGSAA